ncbi:MAG: peptidoglycan DD-metalloendopeptidase family protein [Psychrosphaera sp.]|nr:peptidoglycan DD-metalloendopeptidase family protein [Psychrosphaera sp.]
MNKSIGFFILLIAFYGGHCLAKQTCSKGIMCVETVQANKQVKVWVQNKTYAPLTVYLKFTLTNVIVEELLPLNSTYHGNSKTLAFRLKVKDSKKKWRWSYKYYFQRGALNIQHDNDHVYRLPFATNAAFKLTQGFNGRSSHYADNQYGVDFAMPQGTRIYAARQGTVVGVKQDSNKGGANKKFRNDGNYIAIRHADGSLGEYFHLKYQGALVKHGQSVKRGQAIALSGNTGWSSNPHLHFSVHSAISGQKRVSHPVKFATEYGVINALKAGKTYRATK